MSWDVSRSGLETFSDGFGMVWEKMSDGVETLQFSKMTRSIFPESGYLKIIFLGYPWQKKYQIFEKCCSVDVVKFANDSNVLQEFHKNC